MIARPTATPPPKAEGSGRRIRILRVLGGVARLAAGARDGDQHEGGDAIAKATNRGTHVIAVTRAGRIVAVTRAGRIIASAGRLITAWPVFAACLVAGRAGFAWGSGFAITATREGIPTRAGFTRFGSSTRLGRLRSGFGRGTILGLAAGGAAAPFASAFGAFTSTAAATGGFRPGSASARTATAALSRGGFGDLGLAHHIQAIHLHARDHAAGVGALIPCASATSGPTTSPRSI
jgi:hypothetical protein